MNAPGHPAGDSKLHVGRAVSQAAPVQKSMCAGGCSGCPQSHTTDARKNRTSLECIQIKPLPTIRHGCQSRKPTSCPISILRLSTRPTQPYSCLEVTSAPRASDRPFAQFCSRTYLGVAVALNVRLGRDEPVEGTDTLGRGEVELGSHGEFEGGEKRGFGGRWSIQYTRWKVGEGTRCQISRGGTPSRGGSDRITPRVWQSVRVLSVILCCCPFRVQGTKDRNGNERTRGRGELLAIDRWKIIVGENDMLFER